MKLLYGHILTYHFVYSHFVYDHMSLNEFASINCLLDSNNKQISYVLSA